MSGDEGGFSSTNIYQNGNKYSTLPRSTKFMMEDGCSSPTPVYAVFKKVQQQHNNNNNNANYVNINNNNNNSNNNMQNNNVEQQHSPPSSQMRVVPIEITEKHHSNGGPSASAPSSPFLNIRRKFFATFENKSTEQLHNSNQQNCNSDNKKDQPAMGLAGKKIKVDKCRLSMIKEDTDQEKEELSSSNKHNRVGNNGSFLKLSRLSFRKDRPPKMYECNSSRENLPPMNEPISSSARGGDFDFKSISSPKLVDHESEDEGIYDSVEFRREVGHRRSLDWKPASSSHRESSFLTGLKRPDSLSSLTRLSVKPFERRSIYREWRDQKALENYRMSKLSTAV